TFDAAGKPTAFEVKKKSDQFVLTGAAAKNPAAVETGFEVLSATNKPSRKPYFYARWTPDISKATSPSLLLDLVPTGQPGEVRVYFRNQPVPNAAVVLTPPVGDEQKLTADANGVVRFTTEASGLYQLTYSHHRESTPGFSGGRYYDLVSHNASLT